MKDTRDLIKLVLNDSTAIIIELNSSAGSFLNVRFGLEDLFNGLIWQLAFNKE